MWVFGYGSLIWRPDFAYDESRVGYIDGWARRFWQESTDHRGVPDAPGRVVTLVPDPAERTWGIAFRLPEEVGADILKRLDHREKGGYERHRVSVRDRLGAVLVNEAVMWVGTRDNPNWHGPAPIEEIAATIARSEGPSGHNVEYLLRLAEALRELGADDEHVFGLEDAVRRRATDDVKRRFPELFTESS